MEATHAAEEAHIAEEEIGKAKRSRAPKINVSSCCSQKREYEEKKNWHCSPVCSFCNQLETNDHLFHFFHL
jgi:hypothetical protein